MDLAIKGGKIVSQADINEVNQNEVFDYAYNLLVSSVYPDNVDKRTGDVVCSVVYQSMKKRKRLRVEEVTAVDVEVAVADAEGGEGFRLIPPSSELAQVSDEDRLYNRLLPRTLPLVQATTTSVALYNFLLGKSLALSHKGRFAFNLKIADAEVTVDMQLSQVCRLLNKHGFSAGTGFGELAPHCLADMVQQIPCQMTRVVSRQQLARVLDDDYYLAETDGFCQVQTLIMLAADDFTIFREKSCTPSRPTQYMSFLERIAGRFATIVCALTDAKIKVDVDEAYTLYQTKSMNASSSTTSKPKLSAKEYPFIETGFCMAKAANLNTATFIVDEQSSRPQALRLTAVSMCHESRDYFTLQQLHTITTCHNVGSTGVHIHPITVLSPLPSDYITTLTTLFQDQLIYHLASYGISNTLLDT